MAAQVRRSHKKLQTAKVIVGSATGRVWECRLLSDDQNLPVIRDQQSAISNQRGCDPVAALFNFYPPYLITDSWLLIPDPYAAEAEGIAKTA